MDAGKLHSIAIVCVIAALAFAVLYHICYFIAVNYRGYKNRKAPVFTGRATVHHKHPETEYISGNKVWGNENVHFVTFHTDLGEILKLYMGADNYYRIQDGDTGKLTWQGERFWEFIPEKK